MNAQPIGKETQLYPGRAEKKALRQAEQAGRAFRSSKGCAPDPFRGRLKRKFQT